MPMDSTPSDLTLLSKARMFSFHLQGPEGENRCSPKHPQFHSLPLLPWAQTALFPQLPSGTEIHEMDTGHAMTEPPSLALEAFMSFSNLFIKNKCKDLLNIPGHTYSQRQCFKDGVSLMLRLHTGISPQTTIFFFSPHSNHRSGLHFVEREC